LIVERGMEGFSYTDYTWEIWSLRASATGELVFDNVKVPKTKYLTKYKRIERTVELPDKSKVWHFLGNYWGGNGLL
jgi:glutaryl-CoA dehydrogenase